MYDYYLILYFFTDDNLFYQKMLLFSISFYLILPYKKIPFYLSEII